LGLVLVEVLVMMGANVQNQSFHALCRQGRHLRCRAVPGQGKSGGFRTLIVFRAGTRAIFVHGFAKNEKDNIEEDELVALKKLAGGVAGVRRQDARASCYVWGAAGGEVR
jgi:hypothetical protein